MTEEKLCGRLSNYGEVDKPVREGKEWCGLLVSGAEGSTVPSNSRSEEKASSAGEAEKSEGRPPLQ